MLFIGLDSGTQSTKAIVTNPENGDVLAQASVKYGLLDLPPGHLEQHPDTWIEAVDEAISSCLEQIGSRRSGIRGIGVSGQQHGLVALDANDRPVRAAKLWCDTSTAAECRWLEERFGGPEGLIARSGNAIPPGFTAPKILWLKNHEPENFARTASVLLPHDYINFHLTGVKRMEYGDASGTGLLDVRTRQWCRELIDAIDPRVHDLLPPLGSSLERHGELREELRERWGLPKGVVVSAGGGDNMMGAIGTGNVAPGVVTASLGTSGTLYACAAEPVIDPRGEVAAFCDSADQWLPLVCTMNVTVLTEAVRGLFQWDHATLEQHLNQAPAGADGLTFLPYLNGERTPNLPGGTGVLHGLRTHNFTPAHLARAAVEGVTAGLAYGLGRFRELGVTVSEIRLTGGGSQSPAWRQIAADIFGVPVVCLSTAEGAGLGAALQAAFVALREAGEKVSLADITARAVRPEESTRRLPDEGKRDLYGKLLEKQTALTRSLSAEGWL